MSTGVFFVSFGEDIYANALAHHFELINGCRPVNITGHQQGSLAHFGAQVQGKLGRMGGFTRSLQATHQNDARLALDVEFGVLSTHERRELFLGDFDQELTRLDGSQHLLAHGLLFDPVGKALGYTVIHIGLHQGPADFFGRVGNVRFGNGGFTFQALECLLESVAEIFKHEDSKGSRRIPLYRRVFGSGNIVR